MSSPARERVISTRELLGDARRVWIEHAAQRYLLTVTRNGELILAQQQPASDRRAPRSQV